MASAALPPEIADYFNKWVFGAMFGDTEKIINSGCNLPAALCLSTYTEVLGGFLRGKLGADGESRLNYEAFLHYLGDEYVKIDHELSQHGGLYRMIRCGLVHEYFPKDSSGVARATDPPIERGGILRLQNQVYVILRVYLEDFKRGAKKYFDELSSSPDLQRNFLLSWKNITKYGIKT